MTWLCLLPSALLQHITKTIWDSLLGALNLKDDFKSIEWRRWGATNGSSQSTGYQMSPPSAGLHFGLCKVIGNIKIFSNVQILKSKNHMISNCLVSISVLIHSVVGARDYDSYFELTFYLRLNKKKKISDAIGPKQDFSRLPHAELERMMIINSIASWRWGTMFTYTVSD